MADGAPVKAAGRGGEAGFDAGKKVAGRERHIGVGGRGLRVAVVVTGAGGTSAGRRATGRTGSGGPRRCRGRAVVYADPVDRADGRREEIFGFTPRERHVVSQPPGSVGLVRRP